MSASNPINDKPKRLTLAAKQLAHDCPAWCLTWLPDHTQDILFTGGADGTIKKWNISGTAKKYASLFDDDDDNDTKMNGDNIENESEIKLELTNTGKKSISISPITDIKCVPVAGARNTYLLTTVSVDSFVRVYAINTNDSKNYTLSDDDNSAGIDEYKQFDMNERHRVLLCDANGKKSSPRHLEQYGGCWSSDINTDCSVMATGDQFGQIYLWSLYDDVDDQKKPATVLQALVPMVKLHVNRSRSNSNNAAEPKTLRGAHAMVRGVTFNRRMNPNWLAVSCQEAQRVEVFDIEKCVSIFNRKLTYKEIRDCVWYSGGAESYLCVGCDDNFVHVYDTSQNKKNTKKALIASLPSHKSCVTSVDFGKKQYVASGSMDHTVKLWDLHQNDDKLIETHTDHSDQVWKVRFNAQNDKLA
eukprot:180760_1